MHTAIAVLMLLGAPSAARSQAPTADSRPPAASTAVDDAVCYRFAFGQWTPALDRAAAGHDPEARGGPGAPGGRDWAVDNFGGSALMLFPAWWPAGVSIKLAGAPPAVGATAKGTATALVADGRKQAPVAPITIMGVPCGNPVAAAPATPPTR